MLIHTNTYQYMQYIPCSRGEKLWSSSGLNTDQYMPIQAQYRPNTCQYMPIQNRARPQVFSPSWRYWACITPYWSVSDVYVADNTSQYKFDLWNPCQYRPILHEKIGRYWIVLQYYPILPVAAHILVKLASQPFDLDWFGLICIGSVLGIMSILSLIVYSIIIQTIHTNPNQYIQYITNTNWYIQYQQYIPIWTNTNQYIQYI